MRLLLITSVAIVLSSCSNPQDETEKTYGAQIGIVNHTPDYIYSATVDGGGGGHAGGYSAGVGNICCAVLPHQWRPGLKVKVGWDIPVGAEHTWKERVVDVEKYDKPGSLYLHFFPDGTIRIVVSNWAGSSSNHPIAPPVKP